MGDCRRAATEESGSRRRLSTVGLGTQRSCRHADSRDAAAAGWEPRESWPWHRSLLPPSVLDACDGRAFRCQRAARPRRTARGSHASVKRARGPLSK